MLKTFKKRLKYHKKSGSFTWKESRQGVAKGSVAGSLTNNGYIIIKVNNERYLAHRLAWFFVYGEMPEGIDHINHIKTDNSLKNLRAVSQKENSKNRPKQSNNTSGVTGVCWYKKVGKWSAAIQVNGKRLHLGLFSKFGKAVDARIQAEVLYGFHTNHGK